MSIFTLAGDQLHTERHVCMEAQSGTIIKKTEIEGATKWGPDTYRETDRTDMQTFRQKNRQKEISNRKTAIKTHG